MTVTQVWSEGDSKWYMEMRWFLNIPGHDVSFLSMPLLPRQNKIILTYRKHRICLNMHSLSMIVCFFVIWCKKLRCSGQPVSLSLIFGCTRNGTRSEVRSSPHFLVAKQLEATKMTYQYKGVETSKVWFWIYPFFTWHLATPRFV